MPTLADVLRQTGYSQDGTLGTPMPTESPMTKALADHIKSIPQKFNENQAYQMELLGKAFPGNTYESMMTQGDPKAMAELAMQTPFNAMIAYHGTPHKILGNFDISKVGTGEGAQAYGHGMYFAEAKPVAEQYAKELGAKIDVNGKPLMQQGKIVGSTGNTELDDFLVANLGDVKATRKDLLQSIKEVRPTNLEGAKDYQKLLAELRKSSIGTQNTGNLYKVDIPDEHIPNMLDWDKPLSEQPKAIKDTLSNLFNAEETNVANKVQKDALANYLENVSDTRYPKDRFETALKEAIESGDYGNTFNTSVWDELAEAAPNLDWKQIKKQLSSSGTESITGKTLYEDAVKKYGSPEKASAELNKLGIKGINYLDRGSRESGGTSNFVVFDPSTVKILEENGKPLTRKELIEKQVKELKD